MNCIDDKKIVIFGAGKIGRSFIGQLFSKGGYEVVFVDIFRPLIGELNRKREYRVVIKGESDQVINITNVRGVCLDDHHAVVSEISTAGIAATSVGLGGLAGIFPPLAAGLVERQKQFPGQPLDIIIAENMRDADRYFTIELKKYLPADYQIGKLVGLVETSIGKMVPIMTRKDIAGDMLQIFAEPYNTLILNRKGFKNKVPVINGLAPKENMKAWVDRKLFIHNLGHSASAYIGHLYNPEFIFLWEALEVPEIAGFVRAAMLQAAEILMLEYPGEFTKESLTEHIDDLLYRFRNKALGDTIFRVGCDLGRKLGSGDRLAGAVHKAFDKGLPYHRILCALVCGCYFRAGDEEGAMLREDAEFNNEYGTDVKSILSSVCGFGDVRHRKIIDEACSIDNLVRSEGPMAFIKSYTPDKPENE